MKRSSVLLLVLVGLGVAGWFVWHQPHLATAIYRRILKDKDGVAISLNALEQNYEKQTLLPSFRLHGVLYDRSNRDWILFGRRDQPRARLPVETIAVALKALHLHLAAPGVDIRPENPSEDVLKPVQTVSYFGGVRQNIVGAWMIDFDYWMKLFSLNQKPAPVPGISAYWERALEQLEQEVQTCQATKPGVQKRSNRYWLCASDFKAIEDEATLVLQETPLRVMAESQQDGKGIQARSASPCASRGINDPLAAEFANQLTEHLFELAPVVPITQIEDFARLMACLTWLAEIDPQRDLNPWLTLRIMPADTPDTVEGITMSAVRKHTIEKVGYRIEHTHQIKLSGGVVVSPSLIRTRVQDDSLLRVHRVVLDARPEQESPVWYFTLGQLPKGLL